MTWRAPPRTLNYIDEVKMRKIVFILNAGCAGTDTAELVEFPDNVTEDQLNREAWERALGWAESYGIYPECDKPEDYDENADEKCGWGVDEYSDNIDGYWEDYDAEKHDGILL